MNVSGPRERLIDETCASFARALADKRPTPGGGGATAYVSALATALCAMVGSFTAGNPRYAALEEDVRRLLDEAQGILARLLELVDEDAAAFEPLSEAYAIPRTDPSRAETLEAATKGACRAPLEVMRLTCQTIDLLEEMGEKGSRMLLSDVGCGALFARAALEAASLNVFVNTKGLRDRDFADAVDAECDEMLRVYGPRAERVEAAVMSAMRGRG